MAEFRIAEFRMAQFLRIQPFVKLQNSVIFKRIENVHARINVFGFYYNRGMRMSCAFTLNFGKINAFS